MDVEKKYEFKKKFDNVNFWSIAAEIVLHFSSGQRFVGYQCF
jgi:hypothetical protein